MSDLLEQNRQANLASFAQKGTKTLTTGETYAGKCWGIKAIGGDAAVTADIQIGVNPDADSTFSQTISENDYEFRPFENIICGNGTITLFLY